VVIGIDHDVQSCRWERTSSSGIAVRDLAHAAEKGKNNRRKLEQIPANLAKILKPFVREAGSVRPKKKLQLAMETAAVRAKIIWKQNCVRHSFCSYAVALKGLEWTSDQADHSIAILKRDYREVVTKEDAAKYFSMLLTNQHLSERTSSTAKKSVKEAEATTVSAKWKSHPWCKVRWALRYYSRAAQISSLCAA
jgi:hypothetical protein